VVRITNPKLSGVAPTRWTPYPGISVLYDVPGCAAVGGVEPLERLARARDRDDRLYQHLRALAVEIGSAARTEGIEVALVPWRTYHVTLCDMVNVGNRTRVRADQQPEVARTLDALPDSLLWANSVMRVLLDPEVPWSVWADPVSFQVAGLEVWGQALVAPLSPVGYRSVAAAARHEAARSALAAQLRTRLDVQVQPWRPHVTVGYLANEDDAARARDSLVPRWRSSVRERAMGSSVTFRSASIHGFTDMVSFWRLGQ
jgi:hypothetical protein